MSSQPARRAPSPRPLLTAELLSIGTEIVVGETRDTNAGELARALVEAGVGITRITALPDRLDEVRGAFAAGLERADLVISTGGLGPTPDDLTRESIAAVVGETPTVDPWIEHWLRELWARRGQPFPQVNLKQAWLLPSSTALPNGHGTAPGWWVDRPDSRVIVAMPGPPREMRPMWAEHVLPALRARGLGQAGCVRTYRLIGIGESQLADLLGEPLLRAQNPIVATYARADAVDVRISAVAADGRTAEELVAEAESAVLPIIGPHVWATGAETWPEAIGRRLDRLDWRLAFVELGTGGTLATLLGPLPRLRLVELVGDEAGIGVPSDLEAAAAAIRDRARADVGLAVRAGTAGDDTAVEIAVAGPARVDSVRRTAFLGGYQGRSRAALLAAAELLAHLRAAAGEPEAVPTPSPAGGR